MKKTKKRGWGFDTKNLDRTVRPQDDFFHFAAGGWLKKNPVPKTEPKWGTFYVVRDEGLRRTNTLLVDIAKKKNLTPGSEEQIIRDFYLSGMNEKLRNTLHTKPIEGTLKKIQALENQNDIMRFLISAHKDGLSFVWNIFVGQDDKDSESYITHLYQGGLSLPDRDYYLHTDDKSKLIRTKFVEYVTGVFRMLGDTESDAGKKAKIVLDFETALAKASMDKVKRREVKYTYNKRTVRELSKLAPRVDWVSYFKLLNIDPKKLIVMQPDFIESVDRLLQKESVETWKTYLAFTTADAAAPYLSRKWVMLYFSFYGKVLSGNEKIRPEWKRVSSTLDAHIGEAIGKAYVARYFSENAKKKIHALVDDLFAAYAERIKKLDWMSPATKKKALLKLSLITRKIGYPEKWQSYKGLTILPDDYWGNIIRTSVFETKRNLKRLGKPVDRKEWFIPPQMVNAFYSPNMNEIVFPAGILQPPFFDENADDAINYGAIGSVIGHELTHGFDDEGSKFDGKGNYKNWWTPADRKKFEARTKILVNQFNAFKVGDLSVNGKLTLGENIADLGGLILAYDAYMRRAEKTKPEIIDGFTPEQRFFLGLALFEASHGRPEYERMQVLTDPHSPAIYRVNGPMSNLNEFYQAYDVTEKDKLYRSPKDRAAIW